MRETESLLGPLRHFIEGEGNESVKKFASLQIKVLRELIEREEKTKKKLLGLIEKVRKDLGDVERGVSDVTDDVEGLKADVDALQEGE